MVLAILGNSTTTKQTGTTLPFKFPAHGHDFKYAIVYMNSVRERMRLCRYPPCSKCSESPEAFIYHTDCLWFAKPKCPTRILSDIWHVGHQPFPWANESRALWDFSLLVNYVHSETDVTSTIELLGIIKLLGRLPSELCQLIASYCPEPLLWRYGVAVTWATEEFSQGKLVTLSVCPRRYTKGPTQATNL